MHYHCRYKVEVMVYDGTACLNLLMWDTQVIQHCGKRADQVAKEDMEELGYPPTLDNLIERNALFKINVKLNNIEKDDRVYTISNICNDDDLVKQHLPDDFTSQPNGTVTNPTTWCCKKWVGATLLKNSRLLQISRMTVTIILMWLLGRILFPSKPQAKEMGLERLLEHLE